MARARAVVVACILVVAARSAAASSLFDPALRFRVLSTPRFRVYFHQGEEELARRVGAIAEDVRNRLERELGAPAPRTTHVVLVDQTELANGWATPIPYDTVVLYAVTPPGSDFIGYSDDWLRTAFTHEFTHILHLDRSIGWARVVRAVFGRAPLAFPNLFLPEWQIEGIATYEEGGQTGSGRLHAGDFRAVVGEARRVGRFEPIDRINGGLTDWPGGSAQYAYGVGFHAFLAERFGPDSLAQLARATAGRVPFTASPMFKRIYGKSLGDLWRDYQQSTAPAAAPADQTRQLTHHGFVVTGPRFDGDAIIYSVRTPHAFPSLNRIDWPAAGPTRALTTRYFGDTTAPARNTIYFDQQEIRRNTGTYSDLFAFDRGTGSVRRLTSEARLQEPDLSPDGTTLVCVRNTRDRRELVLVRVGQKGLDPASISVLVSERGTQFNTPRWSPDGRRIAVERHRLGAFSELVVVDAGTGQISVVAAPDRSRVVTPVWHPNGRTIVASVAPPDEVFDLYEFDGSGSRAARRLTRGSNATWPDISPDGTAIVFVGYSPAGFDLFAMPYPASAALPAAPALPTPSTIPVAAASAALSSPSTPYSPWHTLLPTSWWPVVEADRNQVRIGAATQGVDVLGYHGYTASASWLVSGPEGSDAAVLNEPDWSVSYAYARWRPTVFLAASNQTSFFAGTPTSGGEASIGTSQERQIEAGLLYPIQHARITHQGLASIVRSTAHLAPVGQETERTAIRGGWLTSSARTYGYSISPEGGVTIGGTIEAAREALGSSGDATTTAIDGRAYLPGLALHHVVAVRLAGGWSVGDANTRIFHLGGPQSNADAMSFDRDALSLLRGFGSNTFAGSRVALLNVDYRFPIARPQRGTGTWPFLLHTVHGAAFVDAGHAWSRQFHAADVKTSVGAELSADVVVAYAFRFTVAGGAAWGHDGSGNVPDHGTAYVRVGHAF